MKKILLALLLVTGGAAFAQNAPLEGISESTDPDKIRAVERRADEIKAQQQAATSGASDSGAGATSVDKRESKRAKNKKLKRKSDMQRNPDAPPKAQ